MKQKQSSALWVAILVLALAVAGVSAGILLRLRSGETKVESQIESAVSSVEESSSSEEPEEEPPEIPIDFDYLKGINDDIYGWIELHATDQGYPVLSNMADPDHYLRRDINGEDSVAGSIYTQSVYNHSDFSDPCTLIYGHHLRNGTMFGGIQSAIPDLNLDDAGDESNYFTLYTPEKSLTCRICAAGPFSDRHVLYFYDFTDEASFGQFFADLASYPVGEHYASTDFTPVFGDQLVILSTCYSNNYDHRYLIVGVVTEKDGVPTR